MRKATLFVALGILTAVACTVVVQQPQAVAPQPPPPVSRTPAPPPPQPPPPPAQMQTPPGLSLNLPPGQLPAIGECRIWRRGWPTKLQPQPASRSCAGINAIAPAGA